MCTTSPDAYNLAVKLCEDYTRRKQKEKDLNKRKEESKKKQESGAQAGRKVTEIDYGKHEDTVKELVRQEKEEEFARKKNEAAQWCTLDHEHGPNCRRPVGGCSMDKSKEWAIYEKSTAEKIAAADRFRQEGNEAYRKQNFGLAAVHYRKALLQFDYTFAENDEEEQAVESVKVPCLLNLAACKCQQEEWDEVLTQCRLALEINPRSVKAFFRTAQAHIARDHFDLAKDALMSAYEIEPQNAEVRNLYAQLKKNMSNYKVRQKEVFKEMMSGDAGAEAAGKAAGAAAEAPAAEAGEPVQPPPERTEGEKASAKKAEEAPPADAAAGLRESPAVEEARPLQPRARPTAKEEAPPSSPAGGAAAEATEAPATLRQRRGAHEEAEGDATDGDEKDDEEGASLPPKVLNMILLLALLLALVSVVLCALAYSSGS